ncbi:MAG: TlpA family protein disulfide reductase [Kofleriaceae bacterium]
MIWLMVIVLFGAQLRALAQAVWLGELSAGLGFRAAMKVVTATFTVELAFIIVAALALWLLGGRRRNIGRAFDHACVAVIPVLAVYLVVHAIIRVVELGGNVELPGAVNAIVVAAAFGWAGTVVALALVRTAIQPLSGRSRTLARRAGLGLFAVALVGMVAQSIWVTRNLDAIRPIAPGSTAVTFALPSVGADGKLGAAHPLITPGKVTVLDFWATWCGPCLRAMPHLDELAKRHPDVDFVTIVADDPAKARAMFQQHGYQLRLVADPDADAQNRYGVLSYPHTVVIDRAGVVRLVAGGNADAIAAAVVNALGQ